MGEIISLKAKRKDKARSDKEKLAEFNRQKFGQTKTEKDLRKLQAAQEAARLDGHKRDG
jgi:hypothetical protein